MFSSVTIPDDRDIGKCQQKQLGLWSRTKKDYLLDNYL